MTSKRKSVTTWQAHALAQIAQVDAGLARRRGRHRGVHAARKAIRRLRSLLALGADAFGAAGAAIDAALRALVRSLSRVRDAHVVVNSADKLRRRARSKSAKSAALRVRRVLAEQRTHALQAELDRDPDFTRRRRRVAKLRDELIALDWAGLTQDVVLAALNRCRKRSERAGQDAAEEGRSTLRHRWRRRARRLRMQLEALRQIDATGFDVDAQRTGVDQVAGVSRLVDRLGAEQDLMILRRHLLRLPAGKDRQLVLQQLDREISGKRARR